MLDPLPSMVGLFPTDTLPCMTTARILADHDFEIGSVDPRLFGSFAEHLGRCIYGGLYEPGHATATPEGFRGDVLDLVHELGATVIRYPGGNFVSGYRWEDGVGAQAQRPKRRESAWVSTETNAFGTDEFVAWCRQARVEPMLAVNLGTRGLEAAADYAEYCNHPDGTALADQRIANGSPAPHDVRLWCLGNEMDGPWQLGHKGASEYGRLVAECAKAMAIPDQARRVNGLPHQEFVACGSSTPSMPTFGAWEGEVLEACYDQVSYISLHLYVTDQAHDLSCALARGQVMDRYIRDVVATCDAVRARRKSARTIHLCFDEWNVWYHSSNQDRTHTPWTVAPSLLEDVYNAGDALVVGGLLITLLNHADRVKVACLAQLVNVIGPIMTRTGGPAWRQTIFHPFALAARYGQGTVLQTRIECPTYDCAAEKGVPWIAATIVRTATGGVHAFVLNRQLTEAVDLTLELRGFAELTLLEWILLHETDILATNTEAAPNRVRPSSGVGADLRNGTLTATLPPASWSVFRLG